MMKLRILDSIQIIRKELDEESDEEFMQEEKMMEMTLEPEKDAEQAEGKIIAFVSGKGGVGKSGLAINVANFCAENGDRVLLVDCDLSTNGATVFFGLNPEIERQIKGRGDILSTYEIISSITQNPTENIAHLSPVVIKENYHFIPAVIEQEKFNDNFLETREAASLEAELVQLAAKWRKEYKLIILDMSAGESKLNTLLTKILSRICIVMTPGELSRRTVRKRLNFLFKMCNLDKIICCVNMIQSENWMGNPESLFDEFAGFAYSQEYNLDFKKGRMISTEKQHLYQNLAYITKHVYENSSQVLAVCEREKGIVPCGAGREQVILLYKLNNWLSYGENALTVQTVLLISGAAGLSLLDFWQKIPDWFYCLLIGAFFAIQAAITVMVNRIWREIYKKG